VACLAWPVVVTGRATAGDAPQHVIVFKQAGRFGGWPANHGIWAWGNEIVVGHRDAKFKVVKSGHAVDRFAPQEDRQARSLDGGLTWHSEQPAALVRVADGGPRVTRLAAPLDFTKPGFAMMCRYSGRDPASRFYVSEDRAKTWSGPYRLPTFDQPRIMARTDYLVTGPHEMVLFLTAAKRDGEEGRVLCARTGDGGLNWRFVSFIGPEPSGFSIMPSSVALSGNRLLTTIRRQEDPEHWIEAWLSKDGGESWSFLNKPAPSTGGSVGNPPSLVRMRDGRLVITYGYRSQPFGIRACVSGDEGLTWGEETILRDDGGCWDLGYPRSVERPDGRIVTVYYFNDHPDQERYIAGTIWTPPAGK
jgi:hypothetical protein